MYDFDLLCLGTRRLPCGDIAPWLVTALGLMLAACATTTAGNYAKPGFVTEVKDGRLWVFREDSPELKEFRTHGELTKMVTRVGAGPNGMTMRAGDAKVI